MMAAEQWRKYQEDYNKYGIEMTPKNKGAKRNEELLPNNTIVISPRERKLLLLMIAVAAVCCISCILVSAAAAQAEYNINELVQSQNEASGEIDNLNMQIMSVKSMDYVEQYATSNLGMVYPTRNEYVYISKPNQDVNTYIAALSAQLKGGSASAGAGAMALANTVKQGNNQLYSTLAG